MSLWKVSDTATRDLMAAYYTRLMAGEGRGEALRQVQLAMLKGGKGVKQDGSRRGLFGNHPRSGKTDYSHPYYWAAFIVSGDWRGMTQTAPTS
jgi:CHAT domain-containing protein